MTININIRGGLYTLISPLVFDSFDSGFAQARVVYQAAPGNISPVTISGGIPVTGFSCTTLNICTANVPDLPNGLIRASFT